MAMEHSATDVAIDNARPRILFVKCEKGGQTWASGSVSALRDNLADEGWPAVRFTAPFESTVDFARSPFGQLATSVVAKYKFVRQLINTVQGFNIVHLQVCDAQVIARLVLPALVIAKFFGKKVILQFVTAEIEKFLDRSGSWSRPFLKAADRIVVGSRYLEKVAQRARLDAIQVINPIDLTGLKHRTVSKLQPRILMDCPLEQENNVLCGLKAFRLVKQKYPRSELTVVGNGTQRTMLQHVAASNHIHGVRFMDSVNLDELNRFYGHADLFLCSSSIDESPSSIVRAFATGLPIVTTDSDGLLQMVHDRANALVVPVNNHVALADRIIELIEDPSLVTRLSGRGKDEACKYTWALVRRSWIGLYSDLAS